MKSSPVPCCRVREEKIPHSGLTSIKIPLWGPGFRFRFVVFGETVLDE